MKANSMRHFPSVLLPVLVCVFPLDSSLSLEKIILNNGEQQKGSCRMTQSPPIPSSLTSKRSKMYYKFNYQICFRRFWLPVTKRQRKQKNK